MINLSYNLSPKLQSHLEKIDTTRTTILLSSLPPQYELTLRWQTLVERIYCILWLSGFEVTKDTVENALSHGDYKRLSAAGLHVLNVKNVLDHLYWDWSGSKDKIKPESIQKLHELLFTRPARKKDDRFANVEKMVNYFLDYLQSYPEHPIIQAAVAQIQIQDLKPFNSFTPEVSLLTCLLFLYKHGYDCHGLVAYENYWKVHHSSYNQIITNTTTQGRLTSWLEFFAEGLQHEFEKTVKKLAFPESHMGLQSLQLTLNERQRHILKLMENPHMKVTNRTIQKLFTVSQITASRDLTKLANVGLLLAHGKGRSIYYTRV